MKVKILAKKTFQHFQLSFVHVHIDRSRFELKKRKEFKLRIRKAGEGVGHDARAHFLRICVLNPSDIISELK